MSKNNDTKRSQTSVFYYFICHRKSQRSLVTRHRLSCEKANLHNTFVTWAGWNARDLAGVLKTSLPKFTFEFASLHVALPCLWKGRNGGELFCCR